mmetsp:Transcript_7559/g.17154  ORF Transcript_7559/g.17154 Transcript_7559/m.17154 type:complete len:265 (+) Transcript_7559:116-910(+)
MRHGRAKQARRTLQFYSLNASNFKPPYKILLDGTFLVSSIRNKVPLYDRFAKTLQNESFTCHVTRSTLAELETLSKQAFKGEDSEEQINFFAQARQYGLDECEIIDKVPTNSYSNSEAFKEFSDASRDIFNLATEGGSNRQAYFVATQDDTLADALRAMPYVPLFRLGRAVLLLESPSSASRSYTGNVEQNKLASAGGLMTAEERQMVNAVNKKDRKKRKEMKDEEQKKLEKRSREETGGGFNVRRKKRAKGPNPLSCKGKGKK